MNRLAIFDCDGTLVDSGATIHRALRAAFDVHGLECPPPAVSRKVIGLSLFEAMARLAPRMALAPRRDLLGVPSRSIMIRSRARWSSASRFCSSPLLSASPSWRAGRSGPAS